MRPWWTMRRATGIGVTAASAALLLWPAYAAWQEPVRPFYLAALAATAFCGASMLLITAIDIRSRGHRGGRLLAHRLFDVALGAILLGPALVVLRGEWGF